MSTLKITTKKYVVEIEIDRPKALNALNAEVLKELSAALDTVTSEHRVVVLRGAGGKAFVAGADIAAMSTLDEKDADAFCELGQNVTKKLEKMPQICIAVVGGFALGGGCELALACDLIIASENARFGQPETRLGLIPGFGGTQRLVRRIGRAKAMYVLATGGQFSGRDAELAGLVSICVSEGELNVTTEKTIDKILASPLSALALTKKLTLEAEYKELNEGLANEKKAFARLLSGQEAREGMTAFLEKRPANFAAKQ